MSTDRLDHGRYRVEQHLGTGAMGTVVLARDTLLDRPVAVKLLADHLAADDAFRQRFLREARLAARLCHPNIVQVFDAGENGRPFLVMEYVDGETVADRLARGSGFSPAEVLNLATDLSGGLAHAHAMGIVHRDVKPHNVLLGPGGVTKLTDFGIARALEDQGLTEIGTVLGTVHFMAPEQAAGAPVGPAADVFALGAVLRHVAGDSPLPAGLEPLVGAALAPAPEARPSAADLHAQLSAFNAGVATEIATPIPTRVSHHAPTEVGPPSLPGTTVTVAAPARGRGAPWRTPAVIAFAVLAVIVMLMVMFPRGNGTPATPAVPAGTDPAQTARNLATWLRQQGD